MTDLYPTKTRRALLEDVGRGRVSYAENGQIMCYEGIGVMRFPRRVTAAVKELERAGWIRLGPNDTYELTGAGRTVLFGAR